MSFGIGFMFLINTVLATVYKGDRKIKVDPYYSSGPPPAQHYFCYISSYHSIYKLL